MGANAGVTRSGSGGGTQGGSSSSGGNVSNQYSLSGSVSWELDVWGRVRRSVESSEASAAASQADLAATRLSAQASLVLTYLQLRVLDEQKRLLDATVAAYERSLRLTQNRYEVGVAAQADVAVARTQLENTRAQSVDLDWQRGQYEHAIAVLMGQAPSQFSLTPAPFTQRLPQIPVGLPSELLERRPDVAAAERRGRRQCRDRRGAGGLVPQSHPVGGRRFPQRPVRRTADRARALLVARPGVGIDRIRRRRAPGQGGSGARAYDAQAAAYRQAALTGLREVEDYLIQLRVLEQEQVVQGRALEAARESLRLIRNQYEAGLVDYLSVSVVQATALNSERSALSLLGNRLAASVNLIVALGGGWDGLNPPPAQAATAPANAGPAAAAAEPAAATPARP